MWGLRGRFSIDFQNKPFTSLNDSTTAFPNCLSFMAFWSMPSKSVDVPLTMSRRNSATTLPSLESKGRIDKTHLRYWDSSQRPTDLWNINLIPGTVSPMSSRDVGDKLRSTIKGYYVYAVICKQMDLFPSEKTSEKDNQVFLLPTKHELTWNQQDLHLWNQRQFCTQLSFLLLTRLKDS